MPLLPCKLSKTIPLISILRAKRLVSIGQQQKRRNIPRDPSTSEIEVQLTNVRPNVLEVLSLISGGGRSRQGQKSALRSSSVEWFVQSGCVETALMIYFRVRWR